MKTSNLFTKIANGSVGLNGILPIPAQQKAIVQTQVKSPSNLKSIESKVSEHVFSDSELLQKLENKNLSLSNKTRLIFESLPQQQPSNLNQNINSAAQNSAQEYSQKILDNTISTAEYYEKIKSVDENVTMEDVENLFSNIQNSKKNEQLEAKNISKSFDEFDEFDESIYDNVTVKHQQTPRSAESKYFSSEVEKKFETFATFFKNMGEQRNRIDDFATKTLSFAIISTAISVVSAGVAIAYTAAAFFTFGSTTAQAAASWLQTGIMITFTALAWREYYQLINEVNNINKVTGSTLVKSINEYQKIYSALKKQKPNSFGEFHFRNFLNIEQKKEIEDILEASEYSQAFLRDFVLSQTIEVIMDRVIQKKLTDFISKLASKPIVQKLVAIGVNRLTILASEMLKEVFVSANLIATRISMAIISKKALLLGTSWANPITQILTVLDYLTAGLDLTTTLVLTFKK